MRWNRVALLALVAAAGALLAALGCGESDESKDTAAQEIPWRELPAPPISPREHPTGFWTGQEVVLVGGSDAPPCPPNASCRPAKTPPLADGAAYDPATGTWRSIAEAPVGFAWAEKALIGSTAYLWIVGEPRRPEAPSAFLAYRSDADRWEKLPLPTSDGAGWYHLGAAGDRVVAYTSSDEDRERPDFVFDPGSVTWSELPDDPLSPGFDRVLASNGDELVLFDHELVPNPGGDGSPASHRGATFDLDSRQWRVLEDPEEESAGLVWTVDRGWIVDPAFAETHPTQDGEPAVAGVLGEFGSRYYGTTSGLVLDTTTSSWLRMPELVALDKAYGGATEVAVGSDLAVFLGSSWPEGDADGELHSQAWLWSPFD